MAPPDRPDRAGDSGRSDRIAGLLPPATAAISIVVVGALFAYGAWQRRWIADDGLIVLRTVRNLLAGNGPVFNDGERVEANTSTVWTYLVWFFSWVTDGQTEYVVLWVALVLSVAALPIAMWGTYRLTGRRPRPGFAVIVPLGALVYIALPPARDFATSGLEVGLAIFWAAVLWRQLVGWARREPGDGRWSVVALGFTAGLSPLIRPELALVGGLALLMVVCTQMSWRLRVGVIVVAAVLPVGYQIFRMGYYGLLVPNTAIAKDANGAKWSQGFRYLGNLFSPYLLVLPLVVAAVAGLVLVAVSARRGASRPRVASVGRIARARRRLRSPAAVVVLVLIGGVLEALYWLRQGGDFMHGRVLLVPLFLILLPVLIVPIEAPRRGHVGGAGLLGAAGAVLTTSAFVVTVVWAVATSHSPGMHNGGDIGRSGIVDERRFYTQNMSVAHPITAADYLNYPRMRAMVETVQKAQDTGGVLVPSGDYDEWFLDPLPTPPENGGPRQTTVYFLNLGMTSMNVPLDVRVVDQMGLAYPIASHTQRLEYGRIGHDKDLDPEWVIAEARADQRYPEVPLFLSEDWVRQARVALTCPGNSDLIASYKAPLDLARFRRNLVQSFDFTDYRINRIPVYELQRCRLPIPPPVRP